MGDLLDIRILLAEDNKVNQKVALNMFKRMGLNIEIAETGVEVLDRLSIIPYDLIFMDVQMPEMSGVEAAQEINKKWGQERPLIIAMTANAMTGDKERYLEAGMDDYISKPFRIKDIEDALLRHADHFKKKRP